ncbi:MAG: NAD(P)-dependent oxidoreductase, partial [Anaerolineae bacterium]
MIDNANGPSLKVLVADKIAPAGLDLLKSNFAVDVKTGLTEADLCRIIGDYHALVVRSATKVTGRVIEKAFNLKVIARAGAGLDNIDVAAALTQGIEVVNAPNANTKAVAEHTLGLILALARRLPEADLSLKSGLWKKAALTGTGLYGKTLGIVGFGKIGREVTRRALAFGMQVVVNQRRLTPELALEAGIQAVDLVDLLKTSDFVTLHVPLKPETKNLIGAEQLALMKPDAYLINTARGDVVDEAALLAALNDGRLAGAALDVFSEEPARHSQLARHPKVIATPHIAASTGDAQRAAAITVVEQILEILAAGDERNALSLEVLPLPNVLPHEQTDPSRVQRLVNRLSAEKVLKNPPIVTKWKDHYVVLDGATRVTALKALDYRYVVAQVVPHTHNNLGVHVWNHVIEGVSVESLLKLIEYMPEV